MCTSNTLQQKIRQRTNNGDLIVNFLADTVEGKYHDAKYHHKLEAAKLLNRYGFSDDTNHEEPHFWGLIPTPEELAAKKNTPSSSPSCTSMSVTHLDILNYEIAHLIREETADGHTIVEFLAHTMTGSDKPYTPKKLRIKPADRMAASGEILRRGYGHFGRKRKLVVDDYDDTSDYDTLHTDLAKRMREYSEHGTDAVRFLLDVMDAADPDAGFTWNHRVSAAQELLRRGWDTNYDNITPDMLQAYWQNQHSPSAAIRESEDLEAFSNRHSREGGNPSGRGKAGLKPPLPRGEGWGEGEIPLPRIAPNNETIPTRHSAENVSTETAKVTNNTPSTSTKQAADKSEQDKRPYPSCTSMSVSPDEPDCYYEPLTPDQQAIFDYEELLESGEFREGEISIVPPSEAAWKAYRDTLAFMTETAESEGVPLLPNPLAAKLRAPAIRSP